MIKSPHLIYFSSCAAERELFSVFLAFEHWLISRGSEVFQDFAALVDKQSWNLCWFSGQARSHPTNWILFMVVFFYTFSKFRSFIYYKRIIGSLSRKVLFIIKFQQFNLFHVQLHTNVVSTFPKRTLIIRSR